MHVLVTGGTGVLGRPAVDGLLARGHTVRLLSRHAERDAARWPRGVEPHPASVADEAAVRGAAQGCDAVLHIAGVVAEHPPEATFEAINVGGTRHLLAEAARAGVRRFVLVSSLGADRGESDYHRSKRAAEREVEAFPGEWLVVRPGNVYGPGDEVISLLLKMVRTLPVIPLPGDGEQRFQPVWAEDVGRALALAVERHDLSRLSLDLAGAEPVSVNGLLDRLEATTGKRPRRFSIPSLLAHTGAELAEMLGVELPVKSDQLEMLAEENVVPDGRANALAEVFGIDPLPLDDGLARLADSLPERLPADGLGPLRRHRFWADIRGSRLSAADLIRIVREDFRSLPDPELMRVGVEPGSGDVLDEGEALTLAIPLRGTIQVRVEEVTPTSVSAITLEGHPLSGIVRFLAEEEGERLRFEVRTFTRASGVLDLVAMSTVGEPLKDAAWRSLVREVVARSGGEAGDGIEAETEVLDGEAAESVEAWAEGLVRRREWKGADR